ncbi:MAG TPA: galactokinase [Candidatus Angelobacter sp.]|nr:galactokinase [Candidatus Angelobacter sp.]
MQLDYRVQTLAANRGTGLTSGADAPNAQARASLVNEFRQRFGATPRLFGAPGRVNLIGEHIDYNQGLVMPAAISMGVWAAVAPRTDRKIVVYSRQFTEPFEFELDDTSGKRGQWTDYVQGVVIGLRDAGFLLQGANILIHGKVPLGAGLSSSAALEIATAFALTQLAGKTIDPVELAKLCQKAEDEFVGARCGIMDQFISSLGERAHCLMIDCRSLEYSSLRIPDDVCLVVCNTMVKHTNASSEYNTRRAQCEEGVARLAQLLPNISSLRDVSASQLQQCCLDLPKLIRKRCWHVVSEIERVKDAAQALRQRDLSWFGELMRRSHCSLRDNYEVSCRELDIMVEIASRQKGVIGSRMTGGGFGGCTINLVRRDAAEQFKANIASEYDHATGVTPEIYITEASSGVDEVL